MDNVVNLADRRKKGLAQTSADNIDFRDDHKVRREMSRLWQAHYLLTDEIVGPDSDFDNYARGVLLHLRIMQAKISDSRCEFSLVRRYRPYALTLLAIEVFYRKIEGKETFPDCLWDEQPNSMEVLEALLPEPPTLTPRLERFVEAVCARIDAKRFCDLARIPPAYFALLALPRWLKLGIVVWRTGAGESKYLDLSKYMLAQRRLTRIAIASVLGRPDLQWDGASQRWLDRDV